MGPRFGFNTLPNLDFLFFSTQKKIWRHIMLNMNERMNESLFNLNYKIINILRLFNFTRSAILPHNLPKLYSTGRFLWSTICYCAGGRGLKVLNGTFPVKYTLCCRSVGDSRPG